MSKFDPGVVMGGGGVIFQFSDHNSATKAHTYRKPYIFLFLVTRQIISYTFQ